MIGAIRQLPLVLLAMFLGVSQACACTHELQGALAGHEAHEHHARSEAVHQHGAHSGHAARTDLHEDACQTSLPDCDHAPDSQAYLTAAKADLGSKLAHPAAPATVALFADYHAARTAIGQTGPPILVADRRWPNPVTLKDRLLN